MGLSFWKECWGCYWWCSVCHPIKSGCVFCDSIKSCKGLILHGKLKFDCSSGCACVKATLWSFWCKTSELPTLRAQKTFILAYWSHIGTARRCLLVFDGNTVISVMLLGFLSFCGGVLSSNQKWTNQWLGGGNITWRKLSLSLSGDVNVLHLQ